MADLGVQFGLFTGTSVHTSHFKWGLRWCERHTSVVTDPQQVLRQWSSWNYVTFTLSGDLTWIFLKIQHLHLSCLVLGRPGLFLSLKAIFINSILSCNGMKYCEQYKWRFFPSFNFAPKGYLLQQIMRHTAGLIKRNQFLILRVPENFFLPSLHHIFLGISFIYPLPNRKLSMLWEGLALLFLFHPTNWYWSCRVGQNGCLTDWPVTNFYLEGKNLLTTWL